MQILKIKTYIRILLPTMLLPNFITVLFAAKPPLLTVPVKNHPLPRF